MTGAGMTQVACHESSADGVSWGSATHGPGFDGHRTASGGLPGTRLAAINSKAMTA